MLTIESLNSSKDLVAVLADKGVSLRVKQGTPLAEAMSAAKTNGVPIDCLSKIDTLPETLYQPMQPTMMADGGNFDTHTDYQEAASTALGAQLASHISHATTVVLPAIADLIGVIKAAQDHESQSGVASFRVEMVKGSSLLDLSEIIEQVDGFGTVSSPKELPLVLDFKPLGDEDLMKLMQIGATAYDNSVAEFVSQAGMQNIREVWDTVFGGNPAGVANYDVFRSDPTKAEYRNFATFLIASRLLQDKDKLPEVTGDSRMSAAKYPLALRALVEVSGAALYVLLLRKRQQEKLGKLIDRVEGKVVYVNKSVYDRFMNDGGDIETILGAAITSGPSATVPDIQANLEKYQQAWSFYAMREKANAVSSELITVRYAINGYLHQYLRSTDDQVVIDNRELIASQIDQWVSGIYKPALLDVHTLATNTICTVLYNHTEAHRILCGVTDAMQANPSISKEDALCMSVTDYVAAWFAAQIEIDQ